MHTSSSSTTMVDAPASFLEQVPNLGLKSMVSKPLSALSSRFRKPSSSSPSKKEESNPKLAEMSGEADDDNMVKRRLLDVK
ncbi:unnamed protein product, partial [Amoebophrya sp. A25]|eukprot:GSA25T00003868001.1